MAFEMEWWPVGAHDLSKARPSFCFGRKLLFLIFYNQNGGLTGAFGGYLPTKERGCEVAIRGGALLT